MLIQTPQTLIDGELPPTLGPLAVEWIEHNLVYGPGDLHGKPYRLDPFLRNFTYRLYEYDPETGRRLVRRALLGVPKGNSKSEFAAAIGLFELAGPSVVVDGIPQLRNDPDIPIGAASWDQADIVYGAVREMSAPIQEFLLPFDKETLLVDRPGRLYRVAAVAGTNDGRRPTTFIADEVHEWLDAKGRVHLVLSNGLAKRTDSLELNITTAGADKESVAGKLYDYGQKVASGEVVDRSFLMHWYEADPSFDIDKPDELRLAVEDANPASWINTETLAKRYEVDRVPEHEFRRYHLNQWVSAAAEWLPPGEWEDRKVEQGWPEDGTEVVLGFDGSYNRDCTALYGWDVSDDTPHGFVVALWENESLDPHWKVPRHEVQKELHEAMGRWQVRELVCDPWRWESEIEGWHETYGDVVIEFPTNSAKRMSQACSLFYGAVVQDELTHDGDPRMTRHLNNAVVKETRDGAYITKDGRNSPRKIDLAVAGIIGFSRVKHIEEESWASVTLI